MTAVHERAAESGPGKTLPKAVSQMHLIRHNPAMRRLVMSLFFLQLGQSTTWVGIPLLVIERYGLGLDAGLTTGLIVIPSVFLGVAVGNLVDRGNPRNILAVSAVFSGLAVTLFPYTAALWQIQVLAIGVGIGYMFVMPAVMVLRPQVIGTGAEMTGNGLVVTAQRLAMLAGPMMAGPVIAFAGLSWIFRFEAVTALLAAALLVRITVRAQPERPPGPKGRGRRRGWWRWCESLVASVRTIAGLVRGDPKLAALTVTVFTYLIAYGLGTILLASYSLSTFRHLPGMLGYLLGALGVGGAAGAVLAPRMDRLGRGRVYLWASILEGIAWAGLPWLGSVPGALLLMFLGGLLESTATVVFFAEVQPRLSVKYTGRYYALVLPATDACLVIGRALGGFVLPQIGVHWTAMLACVIFAGPAVLLAAPLLSG